MMKIREIVRRIEADGWYLARTRGSHRQYKHPRKRGLVTIAGHPSDDIAPGTLRSILRQAQFEDTAPETDSPEQERDLTEE
jgi:predicted RNA binding protein YcfA (HicA-like mRNA interferase family)